jgi:unsaturated rhamnogalacturonyl hydrolase
VRILIKGIWDMGGNYFRKQNHDKKMKRIKEMFNENLFRSYTILLLFISALMACNTTGQPKEYDLKNWPDRKSPEEIGTRVAERFLKPPHSHYREEATKIHYKVVCTWLGGLWFAEASANDDLFEKFKTNFDPLFDSKEALQPPPTHVDNNVFGSVPLELYLRNKQKKYLDLGLHYADLQWITPDDVKSSRKKFADQGYSWQTRLWIDDMFMITALQVQAFRATGEKKYIDRAARQMVLYLDKLQLENGLFYHHPETPFHWGRGNGWVAAGMAILLQYLPENNPDRNQVMSGYLRMMEGLLKFQEADGMWRQIIDDAESWKETSCTAMFTYAYIIGVKNDWLDKETYGKAARNGWLGLTDYINDDDQLTEICQGTGRGNREHYMKRKRMTGDGHGTAPLLWCATALLEY